MRTMIVERCRAARDTGMLAQFVRYAITGGFVTGLGAALYLALVLATTIHPQIAMFLSYLLCLVTSYVLHGRWSFGGYTARGSKAALGIRFLLATLVSYGLNAFWTWTCTRALALPEWTPVVPLVFVTPLITFQIYRQWVFR